MEEHLTIKQSANDPNLIRFEFEEFFIDVRKDKIVLGSRSGVEPVFHHTLSFGQKSGIIDVHRTLGDGSHETVYAIRKDSISNVLEIVASCYQRFERSILRKARVGWLYHRRILLATLPYSVEDEFGELLSGTPGRKKKIFLRTILPSTRYVDCYDELYEECNARYLMYVWKRGKLKEVGYLHKWKDNNGQMKLHWTKARDMHRLMNDLRQSLVHVLKEYEVQPEELGRLIKTTV